MITLFEPASGEVRVKGTVNCTNAVLHPWFKQQLDQILKGMPPADTDSQASDPRPEWERWQEGLTQPIPLPAELPALRLLLILDNLQGHKSAPFVEWLISHGVMPLYTPVGGSWLNMAESIQGILGHRALSGQHPQNPQQIIDWLEATARGWNNSPTQFHWGGKRAQRRAQARMRRHFLSGSGAYAYRKVSMPGNKQRK